MATQTIKVPKGNEFDLRFEFKVKKADGTIEVVSIADLSEVRVIMQKVNLSEKVELTPYYIENYLCVNISSSLTVGEYNLTISGKLNNRDVSSVMCYCFEIVSCNSKANYTNDEFMASPMVIETDVFVGYEGKGGGTTTDHSKLSNLSYENSGHTGFVKEEVGKSLTDNNLTNELKEGYDSAVLAKHTHENKAVLDEFESGDKAKLDSALQSETDPLYTADKPSIALKSEITNHNASNTAHEDIRQQLLTASKLPIYDESKYELSFENINGQKVVIDLPIEQIGLTYDADTKTLHFINDKGEDVSIQISDLVDVYVGGDTENVLVTVESGNVIKASLSQSFLGSLFSGRYEDLSGKPISLPASDVYAWAKAEAKPTYNYSEIAGTPSIPSKTSDLENDSQFADKTYVDNAIQLAINDSWGGAY